LKQLEQIKINHDRYKTFFSKYPYSGMGCGCMAYGSKYIIGVIGGLALVWANVEKAITERNKRK